MSFSKWLSCPKFHIVGQFFWAVLALSALWVQMQGDCSFAVIVQIDVHHLFRMHHKAQGANLFTQVKKQQQKNQNKKKSTLYVHKAVSTLRTYEHYQKIQVHAFT